MEEKGNRDGALGEQREETSNSSRREFLRVGTLGVAGLAGAAALGTGVLWIWMRESDSQANSDSPTKL